MRKRIVALLLAVCLVVGMVPTAAAARPELPQRNTAVAPAVLESEPEKLEPMGLTTDGLYYVLYSSYVIITGYTGNATSIVIPAEIVGLPVTTIGDSAFYDCSSLKSITIPNGVTSIGERAFSHCSSLTSINIPSSVTSIGDATFSYCSSLTSIIIPSSVTSIGDCVFSFCSSLINIAVDPNSSTYASQNGILYSKDMTQLIAYPGGKLGSVVIPSSVTSIGGSAFMGCSGLTSINIPNGVTSIGDGAFVHCSSLTNINIPSGVTSIGDSAFSSCSSLTNITIPDGVTSIEDDAFSGCRSLTSIGIPSSVTSIGYGAFCYCNSLTSINIPNGVTSIGNFVFAYCNSLTSINIPSSVISIGDCAFDCCSSLTSINIPNSVTSIARSAFIRCSSLTSINIPHGVTSIEDSVFYGCSSLVSINIPSSVTSIGFSAFSYCSGLTSISIPNSVTSIGTYAFCGCSSLTSITIPNNVTSIGDHAFYGCSSLTSISLPSSVTSIDDDAFSGCSNLTDVYYGGSKSDWDAIYIGYNNIDLTNATIHYAKTDPHDTLAELTTEDYLAFSAIAYKQLGPDDGSVQQCLTDNGWWTEKWNKTLDITYGDLCKNIANWTFTYVSDLSSFNGFYAAVFTNDQREAVIAYRGSVPPTGMDSIMSWDFYCDWFLNDLPLELGNKMGPQLDSAIGIYEDVIAGGYSPEKIVLTGHSLGGAWADTVSAYSGSRAETFNAVSILDVLYKDQPKRMAKNFRGVDQWNFMDHANKNDILAGMFEHYLSTEMKPYTVYEGNVELDAAYLDVVVGIVAGMIAAGPGGSIIGNIVAAYGDDIAAAHGLDSLVEVGANGEVRMTAVQDRFKPSQLITNYMLTKNHSVDLGTSHNDTISHSWTVAAARTSYGGDGHDTISTNIRADKLIGGRGTDELDGSWGDDTYIYWIGDGYDTIWDVSGEDTLEICGAPSGSSIAVKVDTETDMVGIHCNDQLIVSIYRKNRDKDKNNFTIRCNGTERNISKDFLTTRYGSFVWIACPVHVEILAPDGSVVFTLNDGEVGSWYTDYGNFYVFEEENGEYGKVLDLVEGYTARIVGAGEGTMDVTYQVPVDGELTEPVSVSNVPVTEELIATVEENEEGDVYLIVDSDGDGETDSEKKLYAECPFEDVTSSDYYYEPVLWAVDEGITDGVTETEFAPEDTCKRSQVVTFLWRAAGEPKAASQSNPFVDVKPGDYFYEAVLWAVEKGITDGMDETHFEPDGVCNRSQVVTFLYRAFKEPPVGSTSNPFTDVPANKWYATPVLWAVKEGITDGVTETSFAPEKPCTRGQVVTFLYRAYVN